MEILSLDLTDLIEQCRAALLDSDPHVIAYADMTELRNNFLPTDLISLPINIYALWTRAQDANWTLKYIGQRSRKNGWRRVSEHLFWKHPKTQSKLDHVLQALLAGEELGVTAILVEPDSLRLAIEAELINLSSRAEAGLPWNIQGKVPGKGPNNSFKPKPLRGSA